MSRRLAALAAALLLVAASGTAAHARSDNRSKPLVFVHGLDAAGTSGANCGSTFGTMLNALRGWGHTGTAYYLGYYDGDHSSCGSRIDGHGSHGAHHAGGHTNYAGFTSHNKDTSIRHLAMHTAWWIYNNHSRHGRHVDVVGHSMGGLITRYAIDRTQRGDGSFPPYLHVEDVLTYGTPHRGANMAHFCGYATQCDEMQPGSGFISYLGTYATNPQASGGTDWTAMGSLHDGVVSESSGSGMSARHRVTVNLAGPYGGVGHSEYMHTPGDTRDADVSYIDYGDSTWTRWYSAPRPLRWGDFALTYGSW